MRVIASLLMCAGLAGAPLARAGVDPRMPQGIVCMTVLLDGRKIGSLRVDREVQGSTITTTRTPSIELLRVGRLLRLRNVASTTADPAGAPLRFYSGSALSSIGNTVTAERLAPGTDRVTTRVGGQTRVDRIVKSPDTGWTSAVPRRSRC